MSNSKERPPIITTEWIKFWWPLGAALLAFGIAWGEMRYTVGTNTEKLQGNARKLESLMKGQTEVVRSVDKLETKQDNHVASRGHEPVTLELRDLDKRQTKTEAEFEHIRKALDRIEDKLSLSKNRQTAR